MTRLFGLMLMAALLFGALHSAGVVTWTPTAWERQDAWRINQAMHDAMRQVGVSIHAPAVPQQPQVRGPQLQPDVQAWLCQVEGVPSGVDGCP
jgi:hypothetical protein